VGAGPARREFNANFLRAFRFDSGRCAHMPVERADGRPAFKLRQAGLKVGSEMSG
jgi:hypothetical protein